MAKTKQPAHALDTGRLQQLVQTLAQYGPVALAALQRLVDILQSRDRTEGGAVGAAPAGAGANYKADVLQRVIDAQVNALAELVYVRDALNEEDEEGWAPGKAGQTQAGQGTTVGTPSPQTGQPTQPPKP